MRDSYDMCVNCALVGVCVCAQMAQSIGDEIVNNYSYMLASCVLQTAAVLFHFGDNALMGRVAWILLATSYAGTRRTEAQHCTQSTGCGECDPGYDERYCIRVHILVQRS